MEAILKRIKYCFKGKPKQVHSEEGDGWFLCLPQRSAMRNQDELKGKLRCGSFPCVLWLKQFMLIVENLKNKVWRSGSTHNPTTQVTTVNLGASFWSFLKSDHLWFLKQWKWRLLQSKTFYFHIMEAMPYKTLHSIEQDDRSLGTWKITTPHSQGPFPQSKCAWAWGDATWTNPQLAPSSPGPIPTWPICNSRHRSRWGWSAPHPDKWESITLGHLLLLNRVLSSGEKNKPREEFSTAPLIMRAAAWEQETLAGIPGRRAHQPPKS